jgi:hypothetical protein
LAAAITSKASSAERAKGACAAVQASHRMFEAEEYLDYMRIDEMI